MNAMKLCYAVAMNCEWCGTEVPEQRWKRTGGYCADCEFMTIPEGIERLHVGRTTFFRLINEHSIARAHPSAHRTLLPRAQIEALLNPGHQLEKIYKKAPSIKKTPSIRTDTSEYAPLTPVPESVSVPQRPESKSDQVKFRSWGFRPNPVTIGSMPPPPEKLFPT